MCLCYLYSGKETGGQEEWIQVREKSKWSKYQKFIKNLFSQQFINSLYFPRNLSHHEDLGVARFLPRFDEEFDYFLIISPTKKIIHISFYKTKKKPAGCWQELKKFAKNWTFARRWSWQCKLNWVFLFDTAFVNSTNISTILRRRWGLWNPGWEGVHYYFEWRV